MHHNVINRRLAALVGCLGLASTISVGGNHRSALAQGSSPVPAAAPAPQQAPRMTLQVGSQGTEVQALQGILVLMGLYNGAIDGVFDTTTQTAVIQFQQMAGLAQDGVVGETTWLKLLPPAPGENPVAVIQPTSTAMVASMPASPATATVATATEPVDPILRNGSEGPAVTRLQQRLSALGFYNGPIDGGFGDMTEAAVKAAQVNAGITDDGVVGPATWQAIR